MTIARKRGARRLLLAVLLPPICVAPAAAQELEGVEIDEQEAEERTCVCLRDITRGVADAARELSDVVVTFGRRAQLGVALGDAEEVDGRMGTRLADVPEGTPAWRAGLREGDIIVALDGEDLGRRPARELMDLMRDVEPGDTVAVTFYRDGDERTVRVVTEEAEGTFFSGRGPGYRFNVAPREHEERMRRMHERMEHMHERMPQMHERMERMHERMPAPGAPPALLRAADRSGPALVAVGPELGRYFGTDRGVLVAEIDEATDLGLRTGDVILAIDGREVAEPRDVRRILASYRGDEEIRFRVVRDERERTVAGRR